ncbi:hypothetical protein COTS27_01379 [Spirochaetota bacterium]|nr:hypothetical protein COTS27_01379 [Spirochaetota bacterium]
MSLNVLTSKEALNDLLTAEQTHHFFIFKHSSSCSVSMSARREVLKYSEHPKSLPIYELEVRDQRPLSNFISDLFSITHESPQIILVKAGNTPVWNCSHFHITEESLENAALENLSPSA